MTIVLVRMWRDWNPYTLLLGLFSKVVSQFYNLKIPQNIKHRVTIVAVVQFLVSDFLPPHVLQHAPASLSFTISWSLLKLMSIELVLQSNHLILCHPLLLLPSVFSNMLL